MPSANWRACPRTRQNVAPSDMEEFKIMLGRLTSFVIGFSTGIPLAVAIGAQNAFILRQGLKREHVLSIVVFCTLSDFCLMACGVFGLGDLAAIAPYMLRFMKWGGCVFLFNFGLRSLARAARFSYLHPAADHKEPM